MNDAPPDGPPTNPEAGLSTDNASTAVETGASSSDPAEQGCRAQKEMKTFFLDNLIRNLDIMIFCELSILYYMDCSLFKFLIRALPHWFYFTPKPDVFPPPPLTHRPYIGTIVGSNLFCILLHILISPPAAGEAARGYLHGGLLIDFVGQASPVSKFRLIGLDVLTLVLQIVMMALTLEKQSLLGRNKPLGAESRNSVLTALDAMGEQVRGQNHDLEERGVLGSEIPAGADDIEMRDLRPGSRGRTGGDEDRERDELLPTEEEDEQGRDEHPLDSFYTGDHVVARLHLLDTIRAQWRTSSAGMSSGSAASTASNIQTAQNFMGRRIAVTLAGTTVGLQNNA